MKKRKIYFSIGDCLLIHGYIKTDIILGKVLKVVNMKLVENTYIVHLYV